MKYSKDGEDVDEDLDANLYVLEAVLVAIITRVLKICFSSVGVGFQVFIFDDVVVAVEGWCFLCCSLFGAFSLGGCVMLVAREGFSFCCVALPFLVASPLFGFGFFFDPFFTSLF